MAESKNAGWAGWVVAALLGLGLLSKCGEGRVPSGLGEEADAPGLASVASLEPEAPPSLELPRYVSSPSLNCRAEPATNGAFVESLTRNKYVIVEQESAGWSKLDRPAPCWVKSAYLQSSPVSEPAPKSRSAPESRPSPQRFGFAGGGGVYYRNCSAARAAGAAPVYAGEPGYAPHLDRDGDGVGCER